MVCESEKKIYNYSSAHAIGIENSTGHRYWWHNKITQI